jgi:hypothetical protein
MITHNKTVLALSLLIMASPHLASADCINSDATGKWRAFLVTGSASFQGFARATLEFAETGSLNAANSEFINSSNKRFRLAKGSMKVSNNCRITGSFLTKSGEGLTIVDGQMNSNKDVISGVYRASTKDVGLINMVR